MSETGNRARASAGGPVTLPIRGGATPAEEVRGSRGAARVRGRHPAPQGELHSLGHRPAGARSQSTETNVDRYTQSGDQATVLRHPVSGGQADAPVEPARGTGSEPRSRTIAGPRAAASAARIDRRLSVAPMMDCTDRHFRYLVRLVTRHTLLYTEMVTSAALVHGRRDHLLDFEEEEHPIALQLGGSDPGELGRCARFAVERGFDEINLNVGCPSDRVRSGRFGACLMAEPDVVARCVEAMIGAGGIPVTVKTRIGIDNRDRYEDLAEFVRSITAAGCGTVIVHARKAWLTGLSPKQNREIPPLRYDVVYRLKDDFPFLEIIVNGGIVSLDEAAAHNERVDGSMMGREAYRNPFVLADADARVFRAGTVTPPDRTEVAGRMAAYARREVERGTRLHHVTRHMLGLFHATNGARRWRRHLSTEAARRNDAGIIEEALRQIGG